MTTLLPWEIVLNIFYYAAIDDVHTASQLCLVNRLSRDHFMPIVWKHVILTGTEQVRQFTYTLVSSPELGSFIKGVTLLDDQDDIKTMVLSLPRWTHYWSKLIKILADLSSNKQLTTLILSRQACRRLECGTDYPFSDIDLEDFVDHQMVASHFSIKHLIISHGDARFYLKNMAVKELTFYGCEKKICSIDPSRDDIRVIRSTSLYKVNFCIGDRVNYKCPMYAHDGQDNVKGPAGRAAHRYRWTSQFANEINDLCSTQVGKPLSNVMLHRETQDALEMLESELGQLEGAISVKVEMWGRATDTNQGQAVMKDYLEKGWIHSCAYRMDMMMWEGNREWCSCFVDDVQEMERAIILEDQGYERYGYESVYPLYEKKVDTEDIESKFKRDQEQISHADRAARSGT